jgi:predicted nucleotidyltransferase component of viral defense system
MSLDPQSAAEVFHLVFLRGLLARVEDKSLVSLKGGCNLRFFFGSIRYSEDIDLDVAVISRNTLRKKVDALLRAPLVTAPLKAHGIELVDVSAPKQTDTTQRWKVGLRLSDREETVRTKIECSRRNAMTGSAFEAVGSSVVSSYGLPPFLATHYRLPEAIVQKIRALHGRKHPQARDVFDLHVLFSLPNAVRDLAVRVGSVLSGAMDRAMGISFDDYRAQVVAYLDPAQAEPFASREAWDLMQSFVIERLEQLEMLSQ